MMGGEFCGNASRSLATFMVYSKYPDIKKVDECYNVIIKVSGVEDTIKCRVTPADKKIVSGLR